MSVDMRLASFLDACGAQAPAEAEPAWLAAGRDGALRQFTALGFPHPRDETWRFSDLRPLRAAMLSPDRIAGTPPTEADLAPYRFPDVAHRLVFIDGRFVPGLSRIGVLPDGVRLGSWRDAVRDRSDFLAAAFAATDRAGGQAFASLNAALCTDGMVLAVAPGVTLPAPIELVQYRAASGGLPVQLRHVVTLGAGSSARIVESALGAGAGCSNSVTAISVGDGAALTHVKLQAEPESAVHLAQTRALLGAGAAFAGFFLVLGGRLSRQEMAVDLAGEGARLVLNGSVVLHGDQEATILPVVDHQAPGGRTQELFKSVLEGAAHSVFLGTITVREGADRTDAQQQNRNLLASPAARVDTRPELTIHADDVRCSHGATVGDLDEAALFYLQSRGIDPHAARRLLIAAFAAETIECAALSPPIQAWLRHHLAVRLGAGGDAR